MALPSMITGVCALIFLMASINPICWSDVEMSGLFEGEIVAPSLGPEVGVVAIT